MIKEGYDVAMKSRLDKYYSADEHKVRTTKNEQLYRTIYDETEYSNVEGISVIEKNEKIDINMIRDLINKNNDLQKSREIVKPRPIEKITIDEDDDRSYDIRDVLSKAKDSRGIDERKLFDTRYNILKNINLNEDIKVPEIKDDDLKGMIEAISTNSKDYTANLLDDLKSIYDPNMREEITKVMEPKEIKQEVIETKPLVKDEIDNSFYTKSMGFSDDDFEDFKQIKEDVKKNNILTKVLIAILVAIVIFGITFLLLHFMK